MDGKQFDQVARKLAIGHSRRNIVKGLAAVGLGALGLGGGSGAAAPRCKETGIRCSKGEQCCSGNCSAGSSRTSICCPAGQVQSPSGVCCAPTTCAAQGKDCGTIPDGCGGTLTCGTCAGPQTCGGGGTPNVCGCTPTTCAAQGATCGSIDDGCGVKLDCGSCAADQVCSQAGCCTPDCTGKTCGADDGCGGTCQTGSCPTFQTCRGGACVDPCSLGTCADCGTNYCAALPGGDAICMIDSSTLCLSECVSDSDCFSPFTTCLSSPSVCGKTTGSCSSVSNYQVCG